jgi:hypothetical protein
MALPAWGGEKKFMQNIRKGRGILFGLYNGMLVRYF